MRISEIFYSLQGEGIYSGIPMVFVRLQGCNLACQYCDTPKARDKNGGIEMTKEEVLLEIFELSPIGWVCITGGEPLLQLRELSGLIDLLKLNNYYTTVETNGSIQLPFWWKKVDSWSFDIKCPSSGNPVSLVDCIEQLRDIDQVKFVVSDNNDLEFVLSCLKNRKVEATILISPVIEEFLDYNLANEVIEFCLRNNFRFSPQVHKLVGFK